MEENTMYIILVVLFLIAVAGMILASVSCSQINTINTDITNLEDDKENYVTLTGKNNFTDENSFEGPLTFTKTINGISTKTFSYLDATSSIQSQLNKITTDMNNQTKYASLSADNQFNGSNYFNKPVTFTSTLNGVDSKTFSYLDATSSIQSQLNKLSSDMNNQSKFAILANDNIFTGKNKFNSLTFDGNINGVDSKTFSYLDPTSSIQTQFNTLNKDVPHLKDDNTFTGKNKFTSLTFDGSINGIDSKTFAYLDPTSSIQTQFDNLSKDIPRLKSDNTFTGKNRFIGDITFDGSINNIAASRFAYLDATSSIQTQINNINTSLTSNIFTSSSGLNVGGPVNLTGDTTMKSGINSLVVNSSGVTGNGVIKMQSNEHVVNLHSGGLSVTAPTTLIGNTSITSGSSNLTVNTSGVTATGDTIIKTVPNTFTFKSTGLDVAVETSVRNTFNYMSMTQAGLNVTADTTIKNTYSNLTMNSTGINLSTETAIKGAPNTVSLTSTGFNVTGDTKLNNGSNSLTLNSSGFNLSGDTTIKNSSNSLTLNSSGFNMSGSTVLKNGSNSITLGSTDLTAEGNVIFKNGSNNLTVNTIGTTVNSPFNVNGNTSLKSAANSLTMDSTGVKTNGPFLMENTNSKLSLTTTGVEVTGNLTTTGVSTLKYGTNSVTVDSAGVKTNGNVSMENTAAKLALTTSGLNITGNLNVSGTFNAGIVFDGPIGTEKRYTPKTPINCFYTPVVLETSPNQMLVNVPFTKGSPKFEVVLYDKPPNCIFQVKYFNLSNAQYCEAFIIYIQNSTPNTFQLHTNAPADKPSIIAKVVDNKLIAEINTVNTSTSAYLGVVITRYC